MEDNRIIHHEEENFDCCAMKPEGAVAVISKEEWEKLREAAKGPGRAYYAERVKRIKWDKNYDPRKR